MFKLWMMWSKSYTFTGFKLQEEQLGEIEMRQVEVIADKLGSTDLGAEKFISLEVRAAE